MGSTYSCGEMSFIWLIDSLDWLVLTVNLISAASPWSFDFERWKKNVNEAKDYLRNCLIKSFWFIVTFLASAGKMFDNGECESHDSCNDKVEWTTVCLLMIVATVVFFCSFRFSVVFHCSLFFWLYIYIYTQTRLIPGNLHL